jgi:hypothetical protein
LRISQFLKNPFVRKFVRKLTIQLLGYGGPSLKSFRSIRIQK